MVITDGLCLVRGSNAKGSYNKASLIEACSLKTNVFNAFNPLTKFDFPEPFPPKTMALFSNLSFSG